MAKKKPSAVHQNRLRKDERKSIIEGLSHPEKGVRVKSVMLLGCLPHSEKVARLKKALFDHDRDVRNTAAELLSVVIGLEKTAKFILKRYPRAMLSQTPAEYFVNQRPSFRRIAKLRRGGDKPISKVAASARGKPDFYHRGFPVYIKKMPSSRTRDRLGQYVNGIIEVNADTAVLPKKFRRVIAEHEFGEIFGHDIGSTLQLLWLEKKVFLKTT